MKKFLSILLALAVGFTFTFGSAMSAFATVTYNEDDVTDIIDTAYSTATATAYEIDYDATDKANDITVFEIDKAAVQSGIYAAYQYAKKEQKDNPSDKTVKITAGNTITLNTDSKAAAIAQVRLAFETAAIAGGAYDGTSEATAFDAYKDALTNLVNSISIEQYTKTKYEDLGVAKFVAHNNNSYETSYEAAQADKDWALAAIAKAKYVDEGSADASTKDLWETSYQNLYTKVFGTVFSPVYNQDDLTAPEKITSITYEMKNSTYSTTAAEKRTEATLEVKKAEAKAKLTSVVTTFETDTKNYKDAYANAVAAYVEAMTYLIDTATSDPTSLIGNKITAATTTTITIDNGTAVDYVARTAAAAKAKADAASNKQVAAIQGAYYDDAKADKDLVKVLRALYKGGTYANQAATYNNVKYELYQAYADLTAGIKAELKAELDYSEVVADETGAHSGEYKFKTSYDTTTGSLTDHYYYAKEWEAIKAAVDAYYTAIDAAKTSLDAEKALEAYKEATLKKNIKSCTEVNAIFTSYTNGMAGAYWTKVKTKAAVTEIYVSWNDGESYATAYADADYIAWAIAKGARTTDEADALYADACKVIDAYKTQAQLTTEATAVQAKIAALPKTITLADKAAVIDAYTAYNALASQFKPYVANSSTLKKAVAKLENLEGAEVIKLVNALPALSKVTVADKAAVKAACEAYEAWKNEAAYKDTTMVANRTAAVTDPTNDGLGYPEKVQEAEYNALVAAYTPLAAKWSVDALTADDAAAIKALQEAVAAYINEYSAAFEGEATLIKMAAAVDNLVKFTDADAKAYVFDQTIKATSVKLGAKKVKVTANFDASKLIENGYTVEYKFYKSTKKSSGYKYTGVTKPADNATYTNTNAKKGKNYYKFKVVVKNADGTVILTTALKDCKYACRTIK